jgi:predicted SAM-dependent methyltransferase
MTPQVHQFLVLHKGKLLDKVLEVGSLNVNGSVRDILDVTVGIDIRAGKGVDLVCSVTDLPKYYPPGSFSACVSTETLEHVEDWRGFVRTTWDMVKEGGWIVMTMASMQKGRHAYPDDYWRMTLDQIKQIYPNAQVLTLGRSGERYASIGWVVQKQGDLGSLEFEPYRVP